MRYLLSNNMTYEDRENMIKLWSAQRRVTGLAWGFGFLVASYAITKAPQLKSMALGWRCCSFLGVALVTKMACSTYNARTYGPLIGGYLRKYQDVGATDAWEIRDRKREYYQIDDSQYMAQSEEEATQNIHRHANHGPQPEGECLDATYLRELDAFLDGKANHLKDHPRFLNYEYEFKDKSYPTLEQAKDLIEGVSQ